MSLAGLRYRFYAACIGLAVTVALALAYAAGLTERLELQALDQLFRHVNRLRPSPAIVHVDITDAALQQVHPWPWPRRLHAELVNLLSELEAARIVFDIVFAEPAPPRVELPQLSADYDLEPTPAVHGQVTAEDAIYDDDELAQAIWRAGNVYLPFFFRLDQPPQTLLQERIADLLRQDFTLQLPALAARLGQPADAVDRVLAGLKQQVAHERVRQILADQPQASAQDVLRMVLGSAAQTLGPDRYDLLRAYRREQALQILLARAPHLPESDHTAPTAYELTPPLPKLLSAARGTGYVIFQADRDGVVRRLPLVAGYRGKLLTQLGLTAACDALGTSDQNITLARNRLVLSLPTGRAITVPLDATGQMLLNWAGPAAGWAQTFRHVPVTRLMEIHANRQTIEQNRKQWLFELAEMVRLFTPAAYPDYEALVRQRRTLQTSPIARAAATAPAASAPAELTGLDAQIATLEGNARYVLQQYYDAAQSQPPADPQEQERFDAARRLHPRLIQGQLAAQIAQANARLAEQIDRRLAELKPIIQGKICIIGYTASAVADIQPTPLYENTPGVMVHSTVLNDLLQARFIRPAGPLANSLLILVAGCLITAVTVSRGPRLSLLFLLFLLVAIGAINALGLFANRHTWACLVSPMLAAFLAWSMITMYRQLTEERAKRHVAAALAQYTSPAIAHRIVQNRAGTDLSPVQREVTSFFSDLQGFTSIAERLGPEPTRALLNPYLVAMSNVLHHRSALINKFYGDGIFAFFNPPLLPCPDHAHQACLAALDSLSALDQLKRQYRSHPLADHFAQLYVRIGIATGDVYVGDFGSATKLDYTCLGDPVNLASRLESANKIFGTRIMVADATRQHAGNDLHFRYLADLQVKGKAQTVSVFELLGPADQLDPACLDYAHRFAQGAELFKQALWQQCMDHFHALLQIRPDDQAAAYYIQICRQFQQTGPPPDWTGQLQLQEK